MGLERDDPDGAELQRALRYVFGEASPEDAAEVERWLAADPSRSALVNDLTLLRDSAQAPGAGRYDAQGALQKARRRRRPVLHDAASARLSRGNRSWGERRSLLGVAAALTLAAAASLTAWRIGQLGGAEHFREFSSTTGSRSTVTLRDGTQLVLGPATHLRVPSDFGRTTRTVLLDGEALFTVVHDAQRPFAVRTTHALVQDVGTTFVVHAYHDDAVEQVAVQEGRVDLAALRNQTVLAAGDLATIGAAGVSVRHAANVGAWVAWVQGGLVFEDAPFAEVAQDLSRTFGVPITVADSALLVRHITAKLSGQPLDLALDAVTRAVGARYERTAGGIVIRTGLASQRAEPATLTTVRTQDTGQR